MTNNLHEKLMAVQKSALQRLANELHATVDDGHGTLIPPNNKSDDTISWHGQTVCLKAAKENPRKLYAYLAGKNPGTAQPIGYYNGDTGKAVRYKEPHKPLPVEEANRPTA